MIKIVDARINTLRTAGKTAEFSEQLSEQVFVLSGKQLQDLIKQSVEPLWKAYENLEHERSLLAQRVKELENKVKSTDQDKERSRKIKTLIDEKKFMSFAELRGLLHLNNVLLWHAIRILFKDYPGEYAIKKDSSDKRARSLIKLPLIGQK